MSRWAPSTEAAVPAAARVRVAITLGDPRGIGPEVVGKALARREVRQLADFVLVGPGGELPGGEALAAAAGCERVVTGTWGAAGDAAEAGRLAGEAIRTAVRLALDGEVDALVTAPIDKAALHAGGWRYPGHTEMLQQLCGVPAVAMMMAAEPTLTDGALRVVLATTHIALRDVPARLTTELLVEQGRLAHAALRPGAAARRRHRGRRAGAGRYRLRARASRRVGRGDRAVPRRRHGCVQDRRVRSRRQRHAGVALPPHLAGPRHRARHRRPRRRERRLDGRGRAARRAPRRTL
jgi:hypothetical protein